MTEQHEYIIRKGHNETGARTLAWRAQQYTNALIYVTKTCNLRCPRCFLHDLPATDRAYMMTWQEYQHILRRLDEQELHLRLLHFTGGEPTLWPHLQEAIALAKKLAVADAIRVVTNGVDRCGEDYGRADIVHVSHYGALNRLDILRLRKQLRRRLKVQYTVHLPWPFRGCSPNNMPADCGCVNLAFVGNRVYPCGLAAARNAPTSVSVDEPFYHLLVNRDPHWQELCRTCISNRRNKIDHMAGLTLEWGVWDSPIGRQWSLAAKGLWLRRLYRRCTGGGKA